MPVTEARNPRLAARATASDRADVRRVKLGVLISSSLLSMLRACGAYLFRYAVSAGLEATGEDAAAANSGSY
jgi:hypothetical protein